MDNPLGLMYRELECCSCKCPLNKLSCLQFLKSEHMKSEQAWYPNQPNLDFRHIRCLNSEYTLWFSDNVCKRKLCKQPMNLIEMVKKNHCFWWILSFWIIFLTFLIKFVLFLIDLEQFNWIRVKLNWFHLNNADSNYKFGSKKSIKIPFKLKF